VKLDSELTVVAGVDEDAEDAETIFRLLMESGGGAATAMG